MSDLKEKRTRRPRFSLDLKELTKPWTDWCASHNLSQTEGVRRVVAAVLEGSPKGQEGPADVSEKGWRAARVHVRVTNAEYAGMTKAATNEGMTVSRWLVGLARVRLTGDTSFSTAEVEALTRSSQMLAAIGRNVNQIARHMNERPDKDELTLAQIELVVREVREHTKIVTGLLAANSDRWRL